MCDEWVSFMVLIALRVVLGLVAVYFVHDATLVDKTVLKAGDTTPAYYLAVFVIVGIANALVWAPFLGKKVSDPITSVLTDSTYVEQENLLLKFL